MIWLYKISIYIVFFILGVFFSMQFGENYLMENKKIHILTEPVLVNSLNEKSGTGGYYLLPKGTVLYDDSDSMNTRVAVYFNVVGDLDLNFVEQDKIIDKQPSELDKIDSLMLDRILKKIKLNSSDIKDIIDHDKDIPDNIKNILYKKYKIEKL